MCPAPKSWNISRRGFCAASAASLAHAVLSPISLAQSAEGIHFNVAEYDRANILAAAADALMRTPKTVSAIPSPARDINPNSYYSEDVEWWPEEAAKGAYEDRPGRTNPGAFTTHRDALVQMNGCVASCVAAWRLTGEARYATHAMLHLRAWFLAPSTRMEPNLERAASVQGKLDGSPRGVEETVALAETVRAASFLCAYNGVATEAESAGLRAWFGSFAQWLNESKKGFIARESKDRLAICWTLQAAECARFARNGTLQLECSHRFRDKLVRQMNFDGQFPAELHRPNAYAASIFTLDCLSVLCEVLSTPMDRYWDYNLADGRGMRSAVAFMFPSLDSRAAWKLPADAEHFRDLPVRQPSLLLAGRAYGRPEYLATWKRLPVEPRAAELLRYFPVRQPSLWTVRAPAA